MPFHLHQTVSLLFRVFREPHVTFQDVCQADNVVAFARDVHRFECTNRRSTCPLAIPLLVTSLFPENDVHCGFLNKNGRQIEKRSAISDVSCWHSDSHLITLVFLNADLVLYEP